MGVLDDAIRDHLDLKRRRGADPAEVERAEREALGPVRRAPEEPGGIEFAPPPGADHEYADDDRAGDSEHDADRYDPFADDPDLDATVVHQLPPEPAPEPDVAPPAPPPPEPDPHLNVPEPQQSLLSDPDESSDDEPPPPARESREEPPKRKSLFATPADETVEYDVEEAFDSGSKDNEDMLEETPEFLQDTPDHDRLWFEQKPPRDFDFDG
jgi:hypothetical protein